MHPCPSNVLLSRLKLRHLRIVLALSQHQSVVRVAEQIHVSPAAVSKSLSEIEALAGMTLFVRERRGMRPTAAGQLMIDNARQILSRIERVSELLGDIRMGASGHINLAVRTVSAYRVVMAAIRDFAQAYPNVSIDLLEGTTADLVLKLTNGEVDFLFAYHYPLFVRPELSFMPIVSEQQLLVVAGNNHPLIRRNHVHAKELLDFPWCIPAKGTRMLDHLERAFHALGLLAPSRGARTSDLNATVSLLQITGFLAIMPAQLGLELQKDKIATVLPVQLTGKVEPVYVVWNSDLALRPPAQLFKDFLVPSH